MTLLKHLKSIGIGQNKHTAGLTVMPLTIPEKVYIPMRSGGSDEAKPKVRAGQYVRVGQLIGDSDGLFGCPVHASVSGTVVATVNIAGSDGKRIPHVVIESDRRQEPTDLEIPDPQNETQFREALRASGIIDGSEGFLPLYKQLEFEPGTVDTLIVNGTECDSYLTCEHATMMTYSGDVLAGIHRIMNALGIPKCILAISDNKPDAIALFKKHISDIYIEDITLAELPTVYPVGEENSLVFAAAGKRIPAGKRAKDLGIAICCVTSVLKFKQYLDSGMPLVSRPVTFDGDAVKRPANVEVPIGMMAGDVIEACRGTVKPVRKIVFGGPLGGTAIRDENVPVGKSVSGILCFSEEAAGVNPETPCIRCGRCARACPISLMPNELSAAYDDGDFDFLKKKNAQLCISCGACSFVCPARRQLSFRITDAKKKLDEKEAAVDGR